MIPWVTVWGFGADVNARGSALFVREKGAHEPRRYAFDDVSHLILAGDNILHTAVVSQCAKRDIPISFFDIHGKPEGGLFQSAVPRFSEKQDNVPSHAFALAAAAEATDSRLRFLHELTEVTPNLFYQGEFEILTDARAEFEYLITIPELVRAYTLTRDMYYEILSRVVPKNLGYTRRVEGASADPVNALFSRGYAILYATVSAACVGAGLDLDKGSLFEKRGSCVYEIMEAALTPMVDKAVVAIAREGYLDDFVLSASRCIVPEVGAAEFAKRLASSIDRRAIDENVYSYAKCVEEGGVVAYRYPV